MSPENVARATVEGMLCALADGLDALKAQGIRPQRVLLIGGAARSRAVRAMAPEIFGLPVTLPDPAEYVALGAARQHGANRRHDRRQRRHRARDVRHQGALAHGRREHMLRDAPFGHRPVVVMWRKRIVRCAEPVCPVATFSEDHPLAGHRAALTRRAITWAGDALEQDDTTVSALVRRLGVGWHTLWRAVKVEAAARVARPGRLDGAETLGVDEHVWRPGRFGAGCDVTGRVDLTRGADGVLRAHCWTRLLGHPGRSTRGGSMARTRRAGVKHAALDPFRGYANALRDGLADAVAVLWTRSAAVSNNRPCSGAGTATTRLYKIRGLLRHGAEHLSERQIARLDAALAAGDPDYEVTVTWQCYQQLCSTTTPPTP